MRKSCRRHSVGIHAPAIVALWILLVAWLGPQGAAVAEPPPDNDPPPPPPLSLPEDPIVSTEPFGYLPGSSQVTLHGEFVYEIPLDVPAGRAGVQPSVRLSYGSSGGNGIAGVGWSLDAGLSEITRCHKTVASDGIADGIDFDATDLFCLDNHKLVLVQGTYGQDGSVYRTERDTFSKILAIGDQGDGPQHFKVWTKDQRILDYEVVTAVRVKGAAGAPGDPSVEGTVRYRWLLREVHDRSGNFLRYHYSIEQEPTAPYSLEVRPTLIEYTRHESGEAGRRAVKFEYEPRTDVGFWYESGVRTRSTQRLKRVVMYAPNPVDTTEVWSYSLDYEVSPTTARSRLSSVRRSDAFGVPLWGKQFSWAASQRPAFDVIDRQGDTGLGSSEDVVESAVLDVDGDGLDDLLYQVGPGNGHTYPTLMFCRSTFASPLGFCDNLGAYDASLKNILFSYSRPGDQDGDGAAELLLARRQYHEDDPPSGHQLLRFDTAQGTFQPVGPFFESAPDGAPTFLLDLDGDGRLDVLRRGTAASESHHWHVHWNTGGSSFGAGQDTGLDDLGGFQARAVDIDGDGRMELLLPSFGGAVGSFLTVGLDDQEEPVQRAAFAEIANLPYKLADLNGDGLRDLVFQGVGFTAAVRYNTGNGFAGTETMPVPAALWPAEVANSGAQVGDLDGDGREDLVTFEDLPVRRTLVHLSRSSGFETIDLAVDPGHKPLESEGWGFPKLGDFNGDGLLDLALISFSSSEDAGSATTISSWIRVLQQRPGASDVIDAVSDEHAVRPRETVSYERTRQNDPPSDCGYWAHCVRHGLQVVREHQTTRQDLPTVVRRHRYFYNDPRTDLRGRGFLGFARVRDFDLDTFVETVTEMDNTTEVGGVYPFAGLPARVTTIAPLLHLPADPVEPAAIPPDETLRARVVQAVHTYTLHWPSPDRYFVTPFATSTTEWEQDAQIGEAVVWLTGDPDVKQRSSNQVGFYDDFGNLTSGWVATLNGTHESFSYTYDNLEGDWLVGLLRRSSVAKGMPGAMPPPRVTAFDYDALGRLVRTEVEPDDPSLWQTMTYRQTPEGLIDKITRIGPGTPAQHAFFAYDDERVFPRATWNDFAHYTRFVRHPALGVTVLAEDPNGVQVSATFDGFGRIRSRKPMGGMATSWSYGPDERAIPGHPTGMRVTTASEDGTSTSIFYDEWGRSWEHDSTGFDGSTIVRERAFNRLGFPSRLYRPGFGAASGDMTETIFDTLGRPVHIVDPDGEKTRLAYSLFETRKWDAKDHESYVRFDANGRVAETGHVVGPQTILTQFGYGSFDQVEHVHDTEGNDTQLGYDHRGRPAFLVDLDLGHVTYTYDGLDQLETETHDSVNGVAQVRTCQRDTLGRVKQVSTPDGVTRFEYDQGPYAKGKLTGTQGPDGVDTTHAWNDVGQSTATTWILGETQLEVRREYDLLGRLSQIQYPEVPTLANRFKINLEYEHGYLAALREPEGEQPNDPLWRAQARNEDDRLTEVEFWNGVVEERDYFASTGRPQLFQAKGDLAQSAFSYGYDATGNVSHRTDLLSGRTEAYEYDEIDRLTQWTLTHGGVSHANTYVYDRLGNITDVKVDGTLVEHNDYGENGAGPHAITTRTLPGQPSLSYDYDPRGRQTTAPGRWVGFSDSDLPRQIGTPAGETFFKYDALGARISKVLGTTETLTLGGLYERRTTPNKVEHVFYVQAEEGPVVEVLFVEGKPDKTMRALHRDALGSVSLVTDDLGEEVERAFYDPFGLRVDADGAAELDPFSVPLGFTGHRHDDELGLIDMKGRIYDPTLRRFLTADPTVPEPLFGQAYNRYSYVLNNPLRYTDPSGFGPDEWSMERAAAAAEKKAEKAEEPSPPPPDPNKMLKNKRTAGSTTGPEVAAGPSGGGEASDSEGHSAGATAPPSTARRVAIFTKDMLVRGAKASPATGLLISIGEIVSADDEEAGRPVSLSIDDIAALYIVGANRPVALVTGPVSDVASLPDDYDSFQNADTVEGKAKSALDAAQKVAGVVAVVYGGAKGVRGLVEAGEERPGGANGGGDAVNPSTIRFSQSSIGRTFSSGGTLRGTIEGLKSGAILPEAFPPIRVVERNGLTFTLDNRRLFVFQEAGVPVRTVPATAAETAAEAWKFTTRNEGASIRVRGGL